MNEIAGRNGDPQQLIKSSFTISLTVVTKNIYRGVGKGAISDISFISILPSITCTVAADKMVDSNPL